MSSVVYVLLPKPWRRFLPGCLSVFIDDHWSIGHLSIRPPYTVRYRTVRTYMHLSSFIPLYPWLTVLVYCNYPTTTWVPHRSPTLRYCSRMNDCCCCVFSLAGSTKNLFSFFRSSQYWTSSSSASAYYISVSRKTHALLGRRSSTAHICDWLFRSGPQSSLS